jgi:hypothetical protein
MYPDICPMTESGTPAPPGLSEAQIAILDQVICSRAQVFLGNFWSTFSWAIIEERYKQGYAVDSNLFLQVLLLRLLPLLIQKYEY